MRDFGKILLGYVLSCAAATFVVALVIGLTEPDGLKTFFTIMVFGFTYIGLFGLPGFALVVLAARICRLRHWLFFAVAGGINATLAWAVVNHTRISQIDLTDKLTLACIAAGIVGGLVYWKIAERRPAAARPGHPLGA